MKKSGGIVESKRRGQHVPTNKLDEKLRKVVRQHDLKFPTLESHYSRNRSQMKYFGNDLYRSRMYSIFKDGCNEYAIPDIDIPKQWMVQ